MTLEDKSSVEKNKKLIQEGFRRDLSLLVDLPKVGHGNTNDGNIAHQAFSNPEEFALITGPDSEVITK